MIDHIGVKVSAFETAKAFYDKALVPLGYGCLMSIPIGEGLFAAGFGELNTKKPDFWISNTSPEVGPSQHVAFRALDRATVDAFYRAALAAGGRDNGAPGLRPHYHANYYGAFVLDPDGHNVEACCHNPEDGI
jgi:catechol 2,3-dioxygenase-like lactoylglutathione lyase family enzyme